MHKCEGSKPGCQHPLCAPRLADFVPHQLLGVLVFGHVAGMPAAVMESGRNDVTIYLKQRVFIKKPLAEALGLVRVPFTGKLFSVTMRLYRSKRGLWSKVTKTLTNQMPNQTAISSHLPVRSGQPPRRQFRLSRRLVRFSRHGLQSMPRHSCAVQPASISN